MGRSEILSLPEGLRVEKFGFCGSKVLTAVAFKQPAGKRIGHMFGAAEASVATTAPAGGPTAIRDGDWRRGLRIDTLVR